MSRRVWVAVLVMAGGLAWSPARPWAAEQFPLPHDVDSLPKPQEVLMGSQRVWMQGFTTSLSIEQLKTFYEAALPKDGWKLDQLPWMATFQEKLAKLEQAKRDHPELEQDPKLKQRVDNMQSEKVQEMMRRELYAVRNQNHLLMSFTPREQGTMVFINRWEDVAPQDVKPGAGPPALSAMAGNWPVTNPCCGSGASVSSTLRKLPSSVPAYPGGRMVSTSAMPALGGKATMFEMYLTHDSMQQVLDYYRTNMAYNGWSPMDVPQATRQQIDAMLGGDAGKVQGSSLAFRNGNAFCGVVIVESVKPVAASASAEAPEKGQPPAPSEPTAITVNYIDGLFSTPQGAHR